MMLPRREISDRAKRAKRGGGENLAQLLATKQVTTRPVQPGHAEGLYGMSWGVHGPCVLLFGEYGEECVEANGTDGICETVMVFHDYAIGKREVRSVSSPCCWWSSIRSRSVRRGRSRNSSCICLDRVSQVKSRPECV